MELTGYVDIYCERTGPGYWAEPVNAITNAAFLIAAFVMWRRTRGAGLPLATLLCAVLAAIGVGSYLWHTHAQGWAGIADVAPIALFVLIFLFAANRDFLGLATPWALAATALFVPYAALAVPLFQELPFFAVSAAYWPLPVLMVVYAGLLARRAPATSRGLLIAAALLAASLTFRSLDAAVCPAMPVGTHFLWHLLNGVLLGWVIEVYRGHMRGPLAGARAGG